MSPVCPRLILKKTKAGSCEAWDALEINSRRQLVGRDKTEMVVEAVRQVTLSASGKHWKNCPVVLDHLMGKAIGIVLEEKWAKQWYANISQIASFSVKIVVIRYIFKIASGNYRYLKIIMIYYQNCLLQNSKWKVVWHFNYNNEKLQWTESCALLN